MSNRVGSQEFAKKRPQAISQQRRIPKARIGGQRATITPSPSHARMSTPGSVHCDGNTNATEDIQEQSELEHSLPQSQPQPPPSPPPPPPSRKPLPKVPPIGPNDRFLINVMDGYIIDFSEAVATRMRHIFKERSDPLGFDWKNLSSETKTFYFEEFKKFFEWDSSINPMMEIAWDRLTKRRYGAYTSSMRARWKKEAWVPMDVWSKWCASWTTPEFLAKCEKGRKNRRQGSDGPALPTHTGTTVRIPSIFN